jgi:hypothetical protein
VLFRRLPNKIHFLTAATPRVQVSALFGFFGDLDLASTAVVGTAISFAFLHRHGRYLAA